MTGNSAQLTQREAFQDWCQNYALAALQAQDRAVQAALIRRHLSTQNVHSLAHTYHITITLSEVYKTWRLQPPIQRQIDAIAHFLRDFQIGLFGQSTPLFPLYEVELFLSPKTPCSLTWIAGKLLLQLPLWRVRWFGYYLSSPQLQTAWQQGKHLPRHSPWLKLWWLFNPLGELRSSLKSTLILAIQKQIFGIDQLLIQFGFLEGDRASSSAPAPTDFKQQTITYLKNSVNLKTLGFDLDTLLQTQAEETLRHILQRYKETLLNPAAISEILDVALIALQDFIDQEQSQVNLTFLGFVNVGNYHRIDVKLQISTGYLKKYIEIVPRHTNVKALLVGFVNVYTIDDITVKPSFNNAIHIDFKTAALEQTLAELGIKN